MRDGDLSERTGLNQGAVAERAPIGVGQVQVVLPFGALGDRAQDDLVSPERIRSPWAQQTRRRARAGLAHR